MSDGSPHPRLPPVAPSSAMPQAQHAADERARRCRRDVRGATRRWPSPTRPRGIGRTGPAGRSGGPPSTAKGRPV